MFPVNTNARVMLARAGKLLPWAILAAAAAWTGPAAVQAGGGKGAEQRRIIIGTELAYPPYSFLDDAGQPAGYNVDMARAVAEAAGLDIELRIGPWDEIRKALAAGKIQAVVGMFQSPQRAREVDFTNSFTEVEHVIFIRPNGRGPASRGDLRGKAIIVMRGDIMHDYALAEGLSANLILAQTLPEALRLLSSGKGDCALAAKLPALYWAGKLGQANIRAVAPPLRTLPYCFAVGKGDNSLLARLEEGLVSVRTTDRHSAITAKWIDPLVPPGIPLRRVLLYAALVLLPLLLSLALALLWSRTLARQVAARTAELRSRNMLLSTMEDVSLDGILVVDESGAILSFNKRFIEMWGVPPGLAEAGVDEPLLKFILWQNEDPEAFYSRVKYLYTHKDEKSRDELRLKDGRFFDRFSSPMSGPGGRYLGRVWFFRDITERKRAEEALRESEEKFRKIIEVSPVPMALNDDRQNITFLNQAFVQTFGYTREEIPALGDWWLKAYPDPEYRQWVADTWKAGIERAKRTGAGFTPMELTVRCKNGMGKTVLASAASVSRSFEGEHLVVLYDITEHKQADSALREAFEMQGVLNAMLQRSIENIPVREKLASHLADLFRLPWFDIQPKGAVLLMNPAGNALVLTAQQGLSPFLLKACAEVPLGRCLCGKAAESGRTMESAEVGADHDITYEGMEPHGHCCTPIIAGGKTLGILNLYLKAGKALTDEQKRFVKHATGIMAENILHARTQNELVQAQKMESVGRLAGGVAHDFNNILTAIKCYSEVLLNGLSPQDPKTADLREILAASDRAAGLTRQLLAFSRRQIMVPKVADLNECVAGITNMLKRLIGENIALTTKLASRPCLALLDTGLIEQVLVNLVVNARDAMPGGGVIELSTELLPPSGKLLLAHPDLPRGPMVCLKVADTGCGMTQEVKNHLYEPFYTTKEQGKGTGLGLSTVFGIVKQSGGDIEVESEPGKGTRFGIYFPYREPMPAVTAANKGAHAAGEVSRRETVLLVEDEESLRRLGKRILSSIGYTVLTAADGPEALKELERHGRPVDLLLTDVVLPGMNGRELALEIARRKMAGRTLYMSGYTDDAIVKHGVLKPGIAFIYKPFTVEALSAKLREVLDGPADQAKA